MGANAIVCERLFLPRYYGTCFIDSYNNPVLENLVKRQGEKTKTFHFCLSSKQTPLHLRLKF